MRIPYFISSQYRFIYKSILMFFFLAIVFLFMEERQKPIKYYILRLLNRKWLMLFLLYSGYLLTATVMGRYYKNPYGYLFANFGFRVDDPTWNSDIINNILLFIPYVFLLLKAYMPKKPFKLSILVSLSTSIFIELSQLIGWLGTFQVADIVHNTIGGICGFIIWAIFTQIVKRLQRITNGV